MPKLAINKLKLNTGQIPGVPKNPRFIKDHRFEQLKSSLSDDPSFTELREPLVYIHNDQNIVVAGNMRLKAAKDLGWKEIPVKIMNPDGKPLDAKLIRSRIIKDNAEYGEDDYDLLANEWAEDPLKDWGVDIPNGFEPEVEIEEDEPPEVDDSEPPKSKLGEVYQLGKHRVLCGDATKREDVELLMDGQKADMVFTDPPYGYSYESNHQKKHKMLMNDDKLIDVYSIVGSHIADVTPLYVCAGFQTIAEWLTLNTYNLKNLIVWKKNNWSMGDLKGAYAGQYEFIIYSTKGRVEPIGGRDRDVWEFDREPPEEHPTMKPIELIVKAISNHKANTVLDIFLGSGSTLIACEQTNRTCCGMEIAPAYVDVIRKRYWKFINDGSEEGWEEGTPAIKQPRLMEVRHE